jgi:hypothetical protein
MKTLKLLIAGIILFVTNATQAQISVSLNIGTPHAVRPVWVSPNCANVDFYYLPEIQTYYDVNTTMFVYLNHGNWIRTRQLPRQYRNYDFNHAHKVALNGYRGNRPYAYYNNHKINYNRYHKAQNYRHIKNRKYADNHRYAEYSRKYDKHDYNKNNNYRRY